MTRDEQSVQAAYEQCRKSHAGTVNAFDFFVMGVRWADSNPYKQSPDWKGPRLMKRAELESE